MLQLELNVGPSVLLLRYKNVISHPAEVLSIYLNEAKFPQQTPNPVRSTSHAAAATERNNPWLSGSFYLFSYVVIITTILAAIIVLNQYGITKTTIALIPIILIAGLLSIGIIGANQLKNDGRLSDKSYVTLMIESYKRLPLLRGKSESNSLPEKSTTEKSRKTHRP